MSDTTSFVDPDYSDGGYQITKTVVKIDGATLKEVLSAETALVEKFSSLGVDAIKYTDLIPPTRDYSEKEAAKIIKDTGADSLFITMVGEKSEIESFVPPTYHAGTTTSYISGYGNFATVNTYTSPGYTTGGYTTSEPIMATKSLLIDLSNGNTVWQADGTSSGESFHSYVDLLISSGKSAITDLHTKGLIQTVDLIETPDPKI